MSKFKSLAAFLLVAVALSACASKEGQETVDSYASRYPVCAMYGEAVYKDQYCAANNYVGSDCNIAYNAFFTQTLLDYYGKNSAALTPCAQNPNKCRTQELLEDHIRNWGNTY